MGIAEAKLKLENKTNSTQSRPSDEDISFVSVAPGDPLIDLVYERLIFPYFPRNDCDEHHAIHTYLAHNDINLSKKIQYFLVAALKNGRLVGTTIFSFVGCKHFCLMNGQYTAVVPEERRRYLAKTLSNYRVEIAENEARRFGYPSLDLSIITLANPQNGSHQPHSHSSPDPTTLQKIWRDFGHERINFPFIQLPLADGKGCSASVLGIKRHSDRYLHRDYLTKEEMKCIVDACNYFRISQAPNVSYPEYRRMLDFLEQRSEIEII